MMPRIQVDAGAIKYVFGGANVMCPGITNPGACTRDSGRVSRGRRTAHSSPPLARRHIALNVWPPLPPPPPIPPHPIPTLPGDRARAPAGGAIPVELPEGAPVAVFAVGKEHAMAIGVLKMSTADMCVPLPHPHSPVEASSVVLVLARLAGRALCSAT